MSFSLEVLVVGQQNKKEIMNDTKIQIINEFDEDNLRFQKTWKFMSSTNGVWYSLGLNNDDMFLALDIINTDFEQPINQTCYSWLEDEDYLENFTPLRVKKEYFNDFKQILDNLLNLSPINMIMILARYQGGDIEIIQGPISFDKYMKMLEIDKIPFNVCSIIQKYN